LTFQLTVYDGARGILKIPHRQKGDFIRLLGLVRQAGGERRPVRLRPVITSGTIRKVKQRLGIPPSRPPRRGRRADPQGKGREMGRNMPIPR
jgi:RNase P/RNase MRP subunit POP5